MTRNSEESELARCLSLIEAQLGWGPAEKWVNYDFEKLSDTIHASTGVRLSTTTLKRIWGKLKYNSAPTLTTLSRFAGYEDWRTFKQSETAKVANLENTPPAFTLKPVRHSNAYYWLLMFIPLSLLGYVLMPSETKHPDPDLYSFKADKMVTEGVPNSVIFHYNAKAAKSDSVFIVQTWDIRRKKNVSPDKTEHSAIYYYPGFFQTKLIVGHDVVKTHDLWITSDGWLSLAENEPVPLYFKKDECVTQNGVEVNEQILKKYNLSLSPKPPRIRFFNQRDFGDLMNENFVFETSVKNDLDDGANACQFVEVLIQCKNDIIIIKLAKRSCAGDLSLYFCGIGVDSKEADLTGFGADLTQWTKLRVETIDKKATLFVNDKKAYSLTFPNEATGIVGVQYRFNGVGAVRDAHFEKDGKTIPL